MDDPPGRVVDNFGVFAALLATVIHHPSAHDRLNYVRVADLVGIDLEQVLIVLGQNLVEIDAKDNYGTQVLQTFFRGETAHDRE